MKSRNMCGREREPTSHTRIRQQTGPIGQKMRTRLPLIYVVHFYLLTGAMGEVYIYI